MQYKFFSNSETAWRAMFREIKRAKDSIYLEMYIFEDNVPLFDFLELLTQKAKNDVRVRIVLDSFGSGKLSREAVEGLREAGAEVLFFSRFLHRIHRKILIVDESVAFVGGVNFSSVARRWNDLMIRVEGKLLPALVSSFAKIYTECDGKDHAVVAKNKKVILRKTRAWLVENFPLHKKKISLKKIYKKHLREAKKNIVLVTPYFVPRRWMVAALHQAVIRGVKVEVLVPKVTNHHFVDRVNYFFMHKVSRLGIEFHLEPHMNHAKVMLLDSKEGLVGSQNLDFLSFELNTELGVFLRDPSAVQKLQHIIKQWKKDAVLFNHKKYRPNFIDYVLSPFVRIFSWLI